MIHSVACVGPEIIGRPVMPEFIGHPVMPEFIGHPVMPEFIGHLKNPGQAGNDDMQHEQEKESKSERRMPRLSGGEEGRGKLRKGSGICKQELIRAYPNGATHWIEDPVHS